MNQLVEEIQKLKKEKNVAILAHYYVNDEIQEIADYIGDSFYLSKVATTIPEQVLLFCGVTFMGESAKILNPEKTVLLPDETADCPMAHMALPDKINLMRKQYEDLAVVCYINSTAELKTCSDVCVTSANALKIVKALPNKHIFFIPDENLGRHIAGLVPEKHFIFNDGYCYVHAAVTKEDVAAARALHPHAEYLVHPECRLEALEGADYIGSTSGIIDYATKSSAHEFIIGTEHGVFYELQKRNPDKKFYPVREDQVCSSMKQITLKKVLDSLKENKAQVEVSEELRKRSNAALNRMLELAK